MEPRGSPEHIYEEGLRFLNTETEAQPAKQSPQQMTLTKLAFYQQGHLTVSQHMHMRVAKL